MRIWAREFKSNHMLKDTVVEDFSDETRTHKIFNALDEICHQFDLSKPIWLESCIADFKRTAKVRFYQDSFIDQIEFDYLEVQLIEEDYLDGGHRRNSLPAVMVAGVPVHSLHPGSIRRSHCLRPVGPSLAVRRE